MQGDFSRLSFDPRRHYRSVRMQQGRVQLDADWNEQIDILNYVIETQLTDIFGPGGAPQATAGFQITIEQGQSDHAPVADADQNGHAQASAHRALDFTISHGRYYVDGILCENEQDTRFSAQPDYPQAHIPPHLSEYCLVYLDVWSRHVTALEEPSLYESALGGIDTTTRERTVWQVKLLPINDHEFSEQHHHRIKCEDIIALPEWQELVNRNARTGSMRARRRHQSSPPDNQLYRVEIHHVHGKEVLFKWSRENGSVVFGVDRVNAYEKSSNGTAQCVALLHHLGRDVTQLQKGDWVEFVDDAAVLHQRTLPLYQVTHVDNARQAVTLSGPASAAVEAIARTTPHPLLLRRWDHGPSSSAQAGGAQPVQEDTWLDLEYGIQVNFSPGTYAIGDYWLIPARTLLDGIDWPSDEHGPLALPPRDSHHHYSPLALLHHKESWTVARDLRQVFAPLPVVTARVEQEPAPRVTEVKEIAAPPVPPPNALTEECVAADELEVGDLVALMPGAYLEVTKAHRENAALIFGVVLSVDEPDEKRCCRVITYGRARCKVVGRVEAGDLLTASKEHGCATRTEPLHEFFKPGALVGKALASHDPGDKHMPGIIDIMVTLQ